MPWDLIPERQHKLYEAAMSKEWQERLDWNAVKVRSMIESRATYNDPVRRRWIIPTRFAYRNKHAAMDPQELMRKQMPLVQAKARLCLQGFRHPDKHKLRTDSPTLSRCGFLFILQTCLDWFFVMFVGDAKSALMQGASAAAAR